MGKRGPKPQKPVITKAEFEAQVWQFLARIRSGSPEHREVKRLIFEASAWAVACGANESSVGFWSADENPYHIHKASAPRVMSGRALKIHWPAQFNPAIPACGAGGEPGQFPISDKVILITCGNCIRLPEVKQRTELKKVG